MNFIRKSRKLFLLIWVGSLAINNSSSIINSVERNILGSENIEKIYSPSADGKVAEKKVSSSKANKNKVKIKEKSNNFEAIIESDEINYTYGAVTSWSSCEPVKYLISSNTTEDEIDSVKTALEIIGQLKGLKFELIGEKDAVASQNWGRKIENNNFRPVLISFTDPSKTDMLGGSNAGATVVNRSGDNKNLIVSGAVAINRDAYMTLEEGFGGGMSRGNLLLHEFGHLVGLGHVDIDSALMNPVISGRTDKGFSEKAILSLSSNKARCERK
jgi:hypothetical protein